MQRIAFKGTRVYKNSQLLAALGMKIGGTYSQQDLQDAAGKLSATGMFTQVAYSFTASSAEYDLVDNQSVFPVHFDNCVWMSDEQMLAKLEDRLPLFSGVVPQQGSLAEDVEKQMEVILGENGVAAKVQYLPVIEGGRMTGMNYTVFQPSVEIGSIDFNGASSELLEALENIAKKYAGTGYTRNALSTIAESSLKPVLLEKGYLHATFGEASLKLLTAAADPVTKVQLSVPVRTGPQYRIATLTMRGDDPIARAAAKQLARFKTGEIINLIEFRKELATLGGAYLAQGYMSAKVKAEPNFDEAAQTVSFEVELLPGERYKLTKLDFEGLDEKLRTKLQSVWTLKVGDAYDATYVPTFLQKNASKVSFLRGYSLAWKQKVNDETKSVELAVFFRPPGSAMQ